MNTLGTIPFADSNDYFQLFGSFGRFVIKLAEYDRSAIAVDNARPHDVGLRVTQAAKHTVAAKASGQKIGGFDRVLQRKNKVSGPIISLMALAASSNCRLVQIKFTSTLEKVAG